MMLIPFIVFPRTMPRRGMGVLGFIPGDGTDNGEQPEEGHREGGDKHGRGAYAITPPTLERSFLPGDDLATGDRYHKEGDETDEQEIGKGKDKLEDESHDKELYRHTEGIDEERTAQSEAPSVSESSEHEDEDCGEGEIPWC